MTQIFPPFDPPIDLLFWINCLLSLRNKKSYRFGSIVPAFEFRWSIKTTFCLKCVSIIIKFYTFLEQNCIKILKYSHCLKALNDEHSAVCCITSNLIWTEYNIHLIVCLNKQRLKPTITLGNIASHHSEWKTRKQPNSI